MLLLWRIRFYEKEYKCSFRHCWGGWTNIGFYSGEREAYAQTEAAKTQISNQETCCGENAEV